MTILLGIILTSCASSKKVNTFKGDMPYVEGTPKDNNCCLFFY